MDFLLSVRCDPEHVSVKRRVRSSSGALRRGSVVEVEMTGSDGANRWLECRVDKWMTGQLWVTEVEGVGAGG